MPDRIVQLKDQNDNNIYPVIAGILYPVGSIYMSVNSTNPATLFGGTWERIKDTFLLACGDTYANGATGGSEKHSHEYGVQLGSYYALPSWEGDANAGVLDYDSDNNISISPAGSNVLAATASFNSGGTTAMTSRSGAYHLRAVGNSSNESGMPPYLAVYVWVRTA